MVSRTVTSPFVLLRWIGQTGLRIDDRLRRWNRVFEYSEDPQCVFRMQMVRAGCDLTLADGIFLRAGDRLINLHLWNEQVPVMPSGRPTVAWGRKLGAAMEQSL